MQSDRKTGLYMGLPPASQRRGRPPGCGRKAKLETGFLGYFLRFRQRVAVNVDFGSSGFRAAFATGAIVPLMPLFDNACERAAMANDARPRDTTAASSEPLDVDFCIIGAGAGGLAVAQVAAAFGQRVVLVEKHKMGGDNLNYGGVPSKALIAAGRRAQAMRDAAHFGIQAVEPRVDYRGVNAYVKDAIAAAAGNASIARYAGMGVFVITAAARFLDKSTVIAGDHRITARFFVIATGSSPLVPDVSGIAEVPYFTNETIFDNAELLPRLIVIGGGGTALELAQAHHRLGSIVTVLEDGHALSGEDPELSAVVLSALRGQGIDIREGAQLTAATRTADGVSVTVTRNGVSEIHDGTHLLIAAGRKPNLANLGLEAAGVRYTKSGITVDRGLRTSNRRVFGIGDVTGQSSSAHGAEDHAGIVLQRALFKLGAKTSKRTVPRVTCTDPQFAHAGLVESAARAGHGRVNVLRWPYAENDRAQIEAVTGGQIKIVTSKRGDILGATIVGADAGELIQMWSLAIAQGLNIKAMTDWVSPYPTLSEISRRAAMRSLTAAPSNPVLRKAIALLGKLG